MFLSLFHGAKETKPLLAVVSVFLGAILSTLFTRMFSLSLGDLRGGFCAWCSGGKLVKHCFKCSSINQYDINPLVYGYFRR